MAGAGVDLAAPSRSPLQSRRWRRAINRRVGPSHPNAASIGLHEGGPALRRAGFVPDEPDPILGNPGSVRPDVRSSGLRCTRAFARDLEPRLAVAVGPGSLEDRLDAPGVTRIQDLQGDIGPGQTVLLRIDDFNLHHEGTLIRRRFRGRGTRRPLRALRGCHWLANSLDGIACARGILLAHRGIPHRPRAGGHQPGNQSRGGHEHQLGVRMDWMTPSTVRTTEHARVPDWRSPSFEGCDQGPACRWISTVARRPPSWNVIPKSADFTPCRRPIVSGPGLGSPGWPSAVDSMVRHLGFQT